jgi:hypothetical protein
MTRIVRGTYRYKRPLKRKKSVTVKVQVVVKAADPVKARKRAALCPSVGAQSAIVTTISRKLSRIMRRRTAAMRPAPFGRTPAKVEAAVGCPSTSVAETPSPPPLVPTTRPTC